MKISASLIILALLAWAPMAQAQRLRVVEDGPGTAQAATTLAGISTVLGELPSDATIEQIVSRIESAPGLQKNPDVVGFLASVGKGRIELASGGSRQVRTLFADLPNQEELVASLEYLATGSGSRPRTCNPLRTWLGTGLDMRVPNQVSARVQQRTLKAMLDAPGDVIELDLDMTTLMPVERILAALRRTGERYDIEEFKHPEQLPLLPGYTGGGFSDFLAKAKFNGKTLPEKYPDLDWDASDLGRRGRVYSSFRGAYWGGDLRTDQVVPGLADFVRRANEHGKMVIFVSGRSSGQGDVSVEALRKGGVIIDEVITGRGRGNAQFGDTILLIGQLGGGDAGTKKTRQEQIRRYWGEPATFADDRFANVAAVEEVADILPVHVRQLGFAAEAQPNATSNTISTFEIRD